MDTRGWQRERTVSTLDPSGRPVPITIGLTHNARGAWVAAMAVGVEATAVISRPVLEKIAANMQATIVNVGRPQDRTEWTFDTLGQAVPITTRRTRNSREELVPIVAIGGVEGAAVITEAIRERLVSNMQAVLVDADQLNRAGA